MARLSIAYFLAWCVLTSAQTPFAGVQKYTVAASNPHAAYSWFRRYLPVVCDTSIGTEWCDAGHSCGYVGRVTLQHEPATPIGAGFGLHAVHSIARPEGPLTLQAIESTFDERLSRSGAVLDPFTDFAAVLYAPEGLDGYAASFKQHKQHFRCVNSMVADSNAHLYSLVVQIPTTTMVIEICSLEKPQVVCDWVDDAVPRISNDVLVNNNATKARHGLLVPLMVSKSVSAAAFNATVHYYQIGLGATQTLSSSSDSGVQVKAFRLAGAEVQIRLVSRPDHAASSTALSVRDLEIGKRAAHARFVVSPLCGFSKLMDTHFGWDHFSVSRNAMMERYLDYFEAHDFKYHIWGAYDKGKPNVYVEDPTGDTVQIDANWEHEPTGAAQDALMDQCSQGNCTAVVEVGCAATLNRMCGALGGLGAPCTDCIFDGFSALQESCSYQEMLSFCLEPKL